MTEAPGSRTFTIATTTEAILEAPVIYLDGAQTFAASDHVVKFNLFQDRLVARPQGSAEPPVERVICARLAMSPVTFVQLANWLAQNAQRMQEFAASQVRAT